MVCQARETADYTGEGRLIEAIAFIDTATSRARSTGIPGINQDQRDTCSSCFVVDKLTQLKERPAMQGGSLTLSNRYPGADAFEVFQGNSASSALSVFHDALADRVVHISGKMRFLLGSLLQTAFGRLGSLGLQLLAEPAVAIAHIIHLRRRVHLPIGVHGNVRHSQVNTHHVSNINRGGLLDLTGSKEIELTVNQGKVGLPMSEAQQIVLPGTTDKGYFLTATQAPDGDPSIGQTPVENSIIVGDRPVFLEPSSHLMVKPVSIGYLTDAPHHDLSRQGEISSCLSIGEFVELILTKGLGLPCRAADRIAGSIRCFQGLTQQLYLSFIREQLDLSCKFHTYIIRQGQNLERRCAFPLPPKAGSFHARSL